LDDAASAGVAQAIVECAGVLPPDRQLGSWRVAAALDHSAAMLNFGICHRDATHGLARDNEAAAFYFRRAAEAGLFKAQAELGRCLVRGIGVPCDRKEGIYWLECAATQGGAVAMATLGDVFVRDAYPTQELKGKHDPEKMALAVKWLGKSALAGFDGSRDRLQYLAMAGVEVARRELERVGAAQR